LTRQSTRQRTTNGRLRSVVERPGFIVARSWTR
jgi:hypothetical protein